MIRLEKIFSWSSCISYDEGHVINEYVMTLCMHDGVEDQKQQSIAYDRLKWWIGNVLSNCILLNESDELLETYRNTRQRVLAVPADPVDHLVAMLLFLKLNSIMEGRLIIDEIKLSSDQGDHMCYLHSNETDEIEFDTKGWWVDPEPVWEDCTAVSPGHNMVRLTKKLRWRDLDLAWEPSPKTDDVIVYADFGKDETK